MDQLNPTPGSLTLIGSGEMTPGMARAHRRVMGQISGEVRPVFLDTPAGFELNYQGISQKAVDYFSEQFGLTMQVASFPNADCATPLSVEEALRTLRRANYIFAGPGSPTYAVRNLRNSPVFETIVAQLGAGGHVVFASAAVVALSRFAIPVYEIYKVGEDPRWTDGLDVLGSFGLDVVFVPHWNNNSGTNHDTTRCFIGESRFGQLQRLLPAPSVVLGIDEYTACVLLFKEQRAEVFGSGSVTVVRSDGAHVYQSGESFDLGMLTQPGAAPAQALPEHAEVMAAFGAALTREECPARALGYLQALDAHARRARQAAGSSPLAEVGARTIRELTAALAVWLERREGAAQAQPAPAQEDAIAPFVQLLLDTRQKLRAAKQFGLADQLRDDLAGLGVRIEDTPDGARWKRNA